MEGDDLSLIPASVRHKLDRIRIKLHLKEWQALVLAERQELVALACDSPGDIDRYRERLIALVRDRTGTSPRGF